MSPTPLYSGKVRDIYAVGDDRLLMVTSDRISAFDVVMDEPIPDKGRVLTAMTAFWSETLAAVAPSHLLSTDLADVPEDLREPGWEGRVMLCHKAEMLPIECIVRGYLTGSAWKEYRTSGTMHGTVLPAGLLESAQLPEPVFTPSTKAEVGDHDENISFAAAVDLVGAEVAHAARDVSLELYRRGAEWAAERGILIADTKFELGMVDGVLTVCDEVLTPGLVPVLAGGPVDTGVDAPVLRQAAGAGPPRRPGLGQDPAASAVAPGGRRGHLGPLRRGLRAHQRATLRRLARRRHLTSGPFARSSTSCATMSAWPPSPCTSR